MKKVDVILGLQWGDEGKGKVVDVLTPHYQVVARFQGGPNAGHTLEFNGEKYVLRSIPSGIFQGDKVNVIGNGVVLDPILFKEEAEAHARSGHDLTERLYISKKAHLILPTHRVLDAAFEAAKGSSKIGTTGKGIGPTYMDKSERSGVRMHDFVDPDRFETVVREACAYKNRVITGVYGGEPVDADAVVAEYRAYAERLRPYVTDTSLLTWEAVQAGKEVLFEGAQGTLLDLDMGTYPFVTSSHPVAGGCCIGSGVGPTAVRSIMGIFKSYTTRVGEGPVPTELFDDTGDYIRNAGGEFGTVTGRPRRTGWFDAVVARYAVRVNGMTEAVINKIDPLRGLPKLKVCVAYRLKNGETVTELPANFLALDGCEPVYEEFDGFDEDITDCRSFAELPQTVQSYIRELERLIGCPITMLGVGPARDQVIELA